MRVVLDIETDGLNPSVIWCIVCKDIDSGEIFIFTDMFEFAEFSKRVTLWVGHNIIPFDVPVINRLTLANIDYHKCLDTLILSRLLNVQLLGGHSLESWGVRLGYSKGDFNDWSKLSQEMIDYCVRDVELSLKVYERLTKKLSGEAWTKPIELEHRIQILCNEMTSNGFAFDIDKATTMMSDLEEQLAVLDEQILRDFPTRVLPLTSVETPVITASGTLHKGKFRWYPGNVDTDFSPGCEYQRIQYEEFNPRSPKQVIDRIGAYWSPIDKTKAHIEELRKRKPDKNRLAHFEIYGYKINEDNLTTLSDDAPPAAKLLVKRLLLDSRLRSLTEWTNLCVEGKIHGQFNPLGAWTQRATHGKPNMANIATSKSLKYTTDELKELAINYGTKMRELWTVSDPKHYLVGTDADSIQLRILAHYMKEQEFTDALVAGKKKDKTDVHSLNQRKLGDVCSTRDNAKTFIYAWLLGASINKVKEILNCTQKKASEAVKNFVAGYQGLDSLKKKDIPRDGERGYMKGLDGRYVVVDEERKVLAAYLQNGEAIIMKLAMTLWYDKLKAMGIPFKIINWVHDEWVTEVTNEEDAKLVGKIQCEAIEQAGILLNMNCPLAGTTAYGKNWADIH